MPNKEVKVVGGLGNATDTDVKAGVVYTSDNGIKRVGTAVYLTGSQTIKGTRTLNPKI